MHTTTASALSQTKQRGTNLQGKAKIRQLQTCTQPPYIDQDGSIWVTVSHTLPHAFASKFRIEHIGVHSPRPHVHALVPAPVAAQLHLQPPNWSGKHAKRRESKSALRNSSVQDTHLQCKRKRHIAYEVQRRLAQPLKQSVTCC